MTTPQLSAAILVVSETAHRDPSSDKCIESLREVFASDGKDQWEIVDTKIVPDRMLEIQNALIKWTDSENDSMNLVVTSGGTGFAVKDVTPEAVTPLIHKHAPGLLHAMLDSSLSVTPFAAMARPVAGLRNKTLILTMPGSPKGARENLQSVIKLLPHACQQAAGADSRAMHVGGVEKLEKDAGIQPVMAQGNHHPYHPHQHHDHNHDHHHHQGGHKIPIPRTKTNVQPRSNYPAEGPSQRNRSSPYPMLSVEEALAIIANTVPQPEAITIPVDESVVGHVLASDVRAIESVPAFRASIVDGYAVITSKKKPSTKGIFSVAFASHAQASESQQLERGQVARITTGAPLPINATAVVMVEDTILKTMTDSGKEEKEVEILTDEIEEGENVREIGSDVKAGDIVMRKGECISAIGGELGLLASVGVKQVSVYRKPVVGILSTGDEIVPHDRPGELKLGEVRDTNRPTLSTVVRAAGFEVLDCGIASDKPEALESALRNALSHSTVLITTGGVSMGELDLLKPTIERALGGTIHFGRVAMKPGKPTTFATVPAENIKDPSSGRRGAAGAGDKVVFSLPGNPASAVVTFMLFVLPALHRLAGISPVGLPVVKVRLEGEVRCDKTREEYHRVYVFAKSGVGAEEGLWASSTGGQRSSRIGSFKGANGLVKLRAGGDVLRKGEVVEAMLMGRLGGVGET